MLEIIFYIVFISSLRRHFPVYESINKAKNLNFCKTLNYLDRRTALMNIAPRRAALKTNPDAGLDLFRLVFAGNAFSDDFPERFPKGIMLSVN